MSDSSPSFKPKKTEEHYEKAAYIDAFGFLFNKQYIRHAKTAFLL